ncbi:MAG: hypothetical protein AAF585_13535 [Verrucomicrobiota bacterium]
MSLLIRVALASSMAVVLVSCQTVDPEERLELYQSVYGDSNYSVIVGTDSGSLSLSDVATIGETVGVYKRLNASESEKIRALAQAKLDGFVLTEMKRLQPQVQRKKAAIRRQSAAAIKKATTEAAREKIRISEAAAIQEVEKEWKRSALIQVEKRYGGSLAVPLRTRDQRPAVAIAKFRGGEVIAPKTAHEVSEPVAGREDTKLMHNNAQAAVVKGEVDIE